MLEQSLYQTYKRYRTLRSHTISALPIAILMPHSACNCRCVMCDIWKGNKNLKQLSEEDIKGLLGSFKRLGTKQVVLSGGEALLHPAFFSLCDFLKKQDIHLTLLSTGMTLKKHAKELVSAVDEVIVSIDGDEVTHDAIRNIQGAFAKLREGVQSLKLINPRFRVTARCVIHKWNFRSWGQIVDAAKSIGVDSISFLPADVSSEAFNRKERWDVDRQENVLIPAEELDELEGVIGTLLTLYAEDFKSRFIVEAPNKVRQIGHYYKAIYGLAEFPFRRCNAPWVSTVVEADGTVRPCFFHDAIGNIHQADLESVLNGDAAKKFRRNLDVGENETCKRCVCSLYLPPGKKPLA